MLTQVIANDSGKYVINDSVHKFYVRSDTPLISNSNYYIAFYMAGTNITFTNRFNLVESTNNLYELELFVQSQVLPLDTVIYNEHDVSFIGFNYPSIENIKKFTEIYYHKIPNDLDTRQKLDKCNEIIVSYHDSQLTQDIRKKYVGLQCMKVYGENTDNVFRFMSGMWGPAYTREKSVLDFIYDIVLLVKYIKKEQNLPTTLRVDNGRELVNINFSN